jgi:hypothetical protein
MVIRLKAKKLHTNPDQSYCTGADSLKNTRESKRGLQYRKLEGAICNQQLQEAHGLSASEAVIFRQLSLEVHTYRDAVEFKNGVRVRLQALSFCQTQVMAGATVQQRFEIA